MYMLYFIQLVMQQQLLLQQMMKAQQTTSTQSELSALPTQQSGPVPQTLPPTTTTSEPASIWRDSNKAGVTLCNYVHNVVHVRVYSHRV